MLKLGIEWPKSRHNYYIYMIVPMIHLSFKTILLFILVAEIIAIKIRNNKEIKGIKSKDTEFKIALMADDTTLFVSNIISLKKAIEEFKLFTICSGLKLNIDKTEIIPMEKLTSKIHNNQLPLSLNNIKINNGPFKALGVWFSNEEK